jgi:hypothetical protein
VFGSKNKSLFACRTDRGGEIKGFIALPVHLESGVHRFGTSAGGPRKYTIGSDGPLIHIDVGGVSIQTLDEARPWLLAYSLRDDVSLHLRIAYASILSLPPESVASYYVGIKPRFAGPSWEGTQRKIFEVQQEKFLGSNLFQLRKQICFPSEANALSILRQSFQRELSRTKPALFGRRYVGEASDDERHDNVVALIVDAFSGYFFAYQLWADDEERSREAAIRRLFGSLGMLDRVKLSLLGKGTKYERIVLSIQRLVFRAYAAFVLFREMAKWTAKRSVRLRDCFHRIDEVLLKDRYLLAEDRFEIIGDRLFNLDWRKEQKPGDSFYVKVVALGSVIRVKNSQGRLFEIEWNIQSYLMQKGACKIGDIVRVEKINAPNAVTARGQRYVDASLDAYYPLAQYRGTVRRKLFAGNSWFIMIAARRIVSGLLWGGSNHAALEAVLGVRRLQFVEHMNKGFSFLKVFVNATWSELIIDRAPSGRIFVVLRDKGGSIVPLAKYVGFFRALEVISSVYDPLKSVIRDVKFVVMMDNVAQLVNREQKLKEYLRERQSRHREREDGEEQLTSVAVLDEKLLLPLAASPDEILGNSDLESDDTKRSLVELNPEVRHLLGVAIVFSEAA